MPERTANTQMNHVQTPMHANCRLCHVAGFSNLCTYSLGGECPYVSLKKTLAKEVTKSV